MIKVHIDFETRSEEDLFASGAYRYAAHPSTELLCVGFKLSGGPLQQIKRDMFAEDDPTADYPVEFYTLKEYAKDPTVLFYAHNAAFERAIWRHTLTKKYGIPEVPIERWRCTMAKAAAMGLPLSLAKAGLALNLPIQKDEAGKTMMLKLSRPRNATKNNPERWFNDPADFERLYAYNGDDVLTEECLDNALPDLSPMEQTVWFMDQRMNDRGVGIDVAFINQVTAMMADHKEIIKKEFAQIVGGYCQSPTQVEKFREWLGANYYKPPNLKEETVQIMLTNKDMPDYVRRALEIRQQLSKTSTAKYLSMADFVEADDRIRGVFMYCGAAQTGRWAGRGFQPQNLPWPTVDSDTVVECAMVGNYDWFSFCYPDVMAALKSGVRGAIVPEKDNVFYVGDFSSIEARVTAWLAGEELALKMFRAGADLYCAMASQIFGRKITKKDKEERQVGKATVLGCGYQMGASKFSVTSKVPLDLAELCVSTYRETFQKIRSFWYQLENAAKQAIQTGQIVQCGKVKFGMHKGFLLCKLPSGRNIAYHHPHVEMMEAPWSTEEDPQYKETITYWAEDSQPPYKYVKQKTYGGKLAENITQAVARDVLVEAMLRLERAGYPPVMTVHDEDVTETRADFGSLEEFETIMSVVPEWAEGLPIAVEAWKGTRYRK